MPRRKTRMRKATKRRKRRMKHDGIRRGVGKTIGGVFPAIGLGVGLSASGKAVKQLPKIGSAAEELL